MGVRPLLGEASYAGTSHLSKPGVCPLVLVLFLFASATPSCAGQKGGANRDGKETLLQGEGKGGSASILSGDRSQSPSRRTSADRPRVESEDTSPFEPDRFALSQARARAEHEQAHHSHAASMQGFSHPSCTPLSEGEKRACPLSQLAWRVAREVAGGLELRASLGERSLRRIRLQLLCHIAYLKQAGPPASCPLQLPGVQVQVYQAGTEVLLRVQTTRSERIEELRRQLKAVIP